jgi:hypothetical protein
VELTLLHEKLSEAWALALAGVTVTERLRQRLADPGLASELARMQREARETHARCHGVASALGVELEDELRAKAQRTRDKAADMLLTWLKPGTDDLAAWTFLVMAEAAEVAAWRVVVRLAEDAEDERFLGLATWALPIQERHLETALEGCTRLAELPADVVNA